MEMKRTEQDDHALYLKLVYNLEVIPGEKGTYWYRDHFDIPMRLSQYWYVRLRKFDTSPLV